MFDAHVDEGRDDRVVADDAEVFQIGQGRAQLRCIHPGDAHQLVGGDPLVSVRMQDGFGQGQQRLPIRCEVDFLFDARAGFLQAGDTQTGRKHLNPVFLADQQTGLLQPGQRGAHARVVGVAIALEVAVRIFGKNFAGRGDDFPAAALLAVQLADGAQDGLDFALRQPAMGREAELPLHIIRRIQEDTAGGLLIATGAAGLLHVVFQRARNVGVQDQPHVGLVDAHAEGVGGDHDPQLAVDEAPLQVLLGLGRNLAVKGGRGVSLVPQEGSQFLGLAAAGAVDDGASGGIGRQVVRQDVVDMGELGRGRRFDHHEIEIATLAAAVQHLQRNTHLIAKILDDLGHHIGFGRRGEAQHRRQRLLARPLADEASDVAVIGPKVMSPFGQAMRLVQHPGADFPLAQGLAQAVAAQLLGRDDQDGHIPQPDALEHIGALGHGQQAVQRGAAADAARLEIGHLIGHERHQGRDDDRQRAGPVIAGQRRDLVADRFARPGRQDAQHVLAPHRRRDDGFLQRSTVRGRRLGAELLEAEPARELVPGVVPCPAPRAIGRAAGRIAQLPDQPPGTRKPMPYPRRHDGIAACHGEPGQRIGEVPAQGFGIRDGGVDGRAAGLIGQQAADGVLDLERGRTQRTAQAREQRGQARGFRGGGGEAMPGQHQIRVCLLTLPQGRALIAKQIQRQPRVLFGVVHAVPLQRTVLVVLDQVVIGIARECQRVQAQRVYGRQVQQAQVRLCGGEMRKVVGDQVVTQDEGRAFGQGIELCQCGSQIAAVVSQRSAGVRADRGELMDAPVLDADFQIDTEAAGLEVLRCCRSALRVHRLVAPTP